MVADQDDLAVQPTDVRIAPFTVRRDTPLEHRARDMKGARDDAVAFAVLARADVDEQRTRLYRRVRVSRGAPFDPVGRRSEEPF